MKASGRSAAIRTSHAMACSLSLSDAHAERIDPLLLEGLAAGESFEVDDAYWHAKKEKHVARLRRAARRLG